ncbi:PTS sugar transporter subunit IIA [Tuanshanicoccus lijuaniae]|uniref:PTS sugar transporter subunit IIA n=1 Tax=Aerococcaceae bacterium zg-1292 TaxID=2774330 RepID=UPI001936BEA8|nr:PTS sugar transporter subunit IIA [Aerococcaceae bacterium zg-1292]QQA37751.1 PTS sugar transporter subunit IIA [Aerococcaceae bacterium zg-1292]
MNLLNIVDESLIVFDKNISTKKQLFLCIAELLENQNRITNKTEIIRAFNKRESEISTGIEEGFGIPHAKSKCVNKPSIVFVHSNNIDDYIALDGTLIECSIAIVVPENDFDAHLDILSSLARKLIDKDFRNMLRESYDANEILGYLKNI